MVQSTGNNNDQSLIEGSMYERYMNAISKIEIEPQNVLLCLQSIQEQIAIQSYFSTSSTSSETIDDITTSILPYITIEYHIGMIYIQLPSDYKNISIRWNNLIKACDYFNAFIQKLEAYDILEKQDKEQYHTLVELTDHINSSTNNINNSNGNTTALGNETSHIQLLPTPNRDKKIEQYKQKQLLQKEYERLQLLQARRQRMCNALSDDEMIDGFDKESLIRSTYITSIHIAKMNTIEEWYSILQELPMISMMIQKQQYGDDRYNNNNNHNDSTINTDTRQQQQQQLQEQQSKPPMQLTQITKDTITGQLRINRQEIQKNIFRPGWNQPTISLDEFANNEVQAAIQRKQQQEIAEINNKEKPRRYEQLVKDGMEDNDNLVDDSALLDREWDTFKDDNPRGCGNKRGDVGDRNF
jgi:immunoglobulin-binding protein 1